jgi:hypothetical protein
MDNSFAEHVELVARFQYYSEEANQRIDDLIIKINDMEQTDINDRTHLLEILAKLKPLIVQKLVLKSISGKADHY